MAAEQTAISPQFRGIISGPKERSLRSHGPDQFTYHWRISSMAVSQFSLLTLLDKWCNAGAHFVPRSQFSKNAEKKDGLQVRCRACHADYRERNKEMLAVRKRAYFEKNKETLRAKKRDYYWRDPELRRANHAEWYRVNGDAFNARRKAAYDADPQYHREQKRQWYHANLDKMKVVNRRAYEKKRDKESYQANLRKNGKLYYSRHPDRVKAKSHRRRSAQGEFSAEQWNWKCEYFGWRCYLCGAALTPTSASPDHRKPIIKRGTNWIANIAPACRYCNAAKRDLSEAEYRVQLQRRGKKGVANA